MCKKFLCFVSIVLIAQVALADSPIPEETPGIPAMESIAYYPPARPVIDGDLSDWIASEAVWKYFGSQEHLLRGAWGGPADSSILWSVMWDDTNLYFAAVVWDDILTEPPDITSGWKGDAIFLYFDGNADGTRDHLLNMFLFEGEPYIISLNNASVSPDRIPYPNGQITIVLDSRMGEAGRFVEAAIPLEYIVDMNAEIGGQFRLNVGLEEGNQAPDSGKFLCWTNQEPGTDGNQFPVYFEGPQVVLETAEFEVPFNGAVDVPQDAALSWKAGASAAAHDVYFGTDLASVTDAAGDNPMDVLLSQAQAETSYDPDGLLDYGQTYYWRIDEIDDSDNTVTGHVWNFTVENYIVDDFEDYNDYPPYEVFSTWVDGFGDPTNGSTAGYPEPDFNADEHYVETKIVHGGNQSMPLFYNNAAGISEVTRTLNADWSDFNSLVIWYYGDSENAAEPMFATLDNAVVTNDNADAALVTEWTRWDISLAAFADQGVNLANVGSMSLGFGNKANPTAGGEGVVYFDDIGLSVATVD